MNRFTLDGMPCAVLHCGHFMMSTEVLFANAPAEERTAALLAHHLNPHTIPFEMNTLFIDTGQNRVLIDPGGYDTPDPLREAMSAAGIDPSSIDTVIITHGHSDHYGGSASAEGIATFPNARYFIQRREWEFWTTVEPNPEPNHAETFRQRLLPLRDWCVLLDGEVEVAPGITTLPTPGHSPGHMAVVIKERLVVPGDVLMSAVQIEHPDWVASFDVWPESVVSSRRALLEHISQKTLLVQAFHFTLPGTGRITPGGEGWKWEPGPIR